MASYAQAVYYDTTQADLPTSLELYSAQAWRTLWRRAAASFKVKENYQLTDEMLAEALLGDHPIIIRYHRRSVYY